MSISAKPMVSDSRRRNMSAIRATNTKPELDVRRALHARGFRFRIHVKTLQGTPDIVLKKYCAVVLVNGCFWHGHDCSLFRLPKTNTEFWKSKIAATKGRDDRNIRSLIEKGWRVAIIWQCSLRTIEARAETIAELDQWLRFGGTMKYETNPKVCRSVILEN